MTHKQLPMTKSLIQRFQISKVAVLCLLLVLVLIAAVPSYWTGYWPWAQPLPVTNIKQLRNLRKTGITLPGWQIKEQRSQVIGGHQWSYQEIQQNDQKPVKLLLLPQKGDKAQPEVEWMDINGLESWQIDSERRLQFTAEARSESLPNSSSQQQEARGDATAPLASRKQSKPAKIEARFFRAWNRSQTFAVLQWYAWPDGGNPDPSSWFFVDQIAQLHRHRVPWVAVSLHIPIQPLGDIETAHTKAEALGQAVQAALMADYL